MSAPDRGLLRVVRASAVAFCVVALSLVAHVLAGGAPPGTLVLLGTIVAVSAYAGALTRERLGVPQLAVVLGAGQLVLHTVFMTGGEHHGGGLPMIAAHVVATLVLAVSLAHGERAAWRLWCWLAPRLATPCPAVALPRRTPCLADTAVVLVQVWWVGTSATWRGPPVPGDSPTP